MNIIGGKFGNRPPGGGDLESPPKMKDGDFYDLKPPSRIGGKIFSRVQCEYRVPGHANEYVVKGIPDGGDKPESFVLGFTDRGVIVNRSEKQSF